MKYHLFGSKHSIYYRGLEDWRKRRPISPPESFVNLLWTEGWDIDNLFSDCCTYVFEEDWSSCYGSYFLWVVNYKNSWFEGNSQTRYSRSECLFHLSEWVQNLKRALGITRSWLRHDQRFFIRPFSPDFIRPYIDMQCDNLTASLRMRMNDYEKGTVFIIRNVTIVVAHRSYDKLSVFSLFCREITHRNNRLQAQNEKVSQNTVAKVLMIYGQSLHSKSSRPLNRAVLTVVTADNL